MKAFTLLVLISLASFSLQAQVTEREVTFENGPVTLAGTITYPEGQGPHPGIILISGSGPQDRNSDLFGFQPFRILSEHLASAGIAVLRVDDRGTGQSTGGSPMTVTSVELSTDVQAAYAFFRQDSLIDTNKIGLLGHSEGGVIAPMVAAANPEIAYIVLMAGYGVPGMELTLAQQRSILEAQGMDAELTDKMVKTNQKVLALLEADYSGERLTDSIQAYMIDMYAYLPEEMKAQMSEEVFVNSQVSNVKNQLDSPWTRFFLTYDPAPVLSKIKCPVLMLFGGKDTQVPAEQNASLMQGILEEAGNDEVEVLIYPDANHLFQKAGSGSPAEYQALPKEFVENFLTDITSWINDQVNTP